MSFSGSGTVKAVAVSRPARLRGEITAPGDKSISHRAAILNAVANGEARVTNFSTGADCASTVEMLRALGVDIDHRPGSASRGGELTVRGVGMNGLSEPADVLDAGNSGTTTRLMSGILAGRDFQAIISGDASIRSRPMGRVIDPLVEMGANISARDGGRLAPIVFHGGDLRGIEYVQGVASAQVKSCLLFAGLRADGETTVRSPAISRDHSERMLAAMGAPVRTDGPDVSITASELSAVDVEVPGDISSAAFWLVAGVIHPDAEVTIRNVGLNPTRAGVLTVLREMGADIETINEREVAGEPVGDLIARSSALHGIEISGEIVPLLIDEIPVLAVAAAQADGETVFADSEELRVKETDRIAATVEWMVAAGADVEDRPDGMVIRGGRPIRGVTARSHDDHRIAMALAVAGLVAEGEMRIEEAGAAEISYPSFWRDLSTISGTVA
ncbi:MAG: 3-phosphoshikimate 1-carboxyvinyltransferase [Chloroflexi bacterium]|nr:3-phosphoshikimate 1-carboxyvinyltransferase [Chloroflexota bacterium]MCH8222187.1 3-phosphoshikimate 1-carboxyvinyltransferase [Chloroflexota bacterium]